MALNRVGPSPHASFPNSSQTQRVFWTTSRVVTKVCSTEPAYPRFAISTPLYVQLGSATKMSDSVVKLGILSTASIVETILNCLQHVPTCSAIAIASRNLERAQQYAKTHQIPFSCDYEGLLTQPIDAVYIPLPTALATDWAVRCANAGKHVIVDKPFSSSQGLERILQACDQNDVIFMDATHFPHAARSAIVRQRINEGAIGKVKSVVTVFCCPTRLAGNIRTKPDLEPMTGLGDLGWYTVRSAVTYLGIERTTNIVSVKCKAKFHPEYEGAIESAHGVVVFESGEKETVSLSFTCDQNCSFDQSVRIYGTTGQIEVPEFVVPHNQTDFFGALRKPELYSTDTTLNLTKTVSGQDADGQPVLMFPVTETEHIVEKANLSQPSAMFAMFSRMIIEKDKETARRLARETLQTQRVLDIAFGSINKELAQSKWT